MKPLEPVKARIKLWVQALRSGKYKQASNHLRTKEGYCCLAVATDIYRKATGKGKFVFNKTLLIYEFVEAGDREEGTLPDRVAAWFGFPGEDTGTAFDKDPYLDLDVAGLSWPFRNARASVCNDKIHMNFNQIADAIERTFLKKPKEKTK